jgi:hypothetical protein
MRIPSRCSCGGRSMVYCTIRHASFVVRYRRCDSCHQTSKSIQMKIGMSSNNSIDVALSVVTIRKSFEPREIP